MPVVYGLAEECVSGGFSVGKAMDGGEREASWERWIVEEPESTTDGCYGGGVLADGACVLWSVVSAHLCVAARAWVVLWMASVVVVNRVPR